MKSASSVKIRTKIVMRVLDERWTTSRSDITRLTAMPISTFQTIVNTNVRAIRVRSTQLRSLGKSNVVRRTST